ncbi:hypothetical protein ABZ672_49655, partial [Streptomyces mirabilis]|uniref:hypothetical protein n=1 Tax=Streptomyces mirabilis TaxID=68239 RepID=UPI00340DBE5D
MSENHDAIVTDAKSEGAGGCPVAHGRAAHPTQGGGNRQWWPERLNLKILAKNPAVANPLGGEPCACRAAVPKTVTRMERPRVPPRHCRVCS